jgi:CRP-like cAMP-binding protein
MSGPDQSDVGNILLSALSAEDYALLGPHLTRVELSLNQTLIEPEASIAYSWFPEDGVCSLICSTAQGRQVEVAVIGRDGLVDTAVVHGTDRTPLLCVVQIPGDGWRIRAEALRRAADASETLEKLLLAYAQTVFVQVAHTALANASHTIGQRLARWLLMSHDRLRGPEIRLTHERLSLMLGVRRAGVTVAIQTLEAAGLVTARRGVVVIVDRPALERYAVDSYGTPEAEYLRLIGRSPN